MKDRKEYKRQWYKSNHEKCLSNKREYYLSNREKILEYQRQWRAKNRLKKREMDKKWRQEHSTEKILQNLVRRARIKGTTVDNFRKEEISNWSTKVCGICHKLIEDGFHIDHIIPLSKGGTHTIDNLQLAHPFCNLSKGSNYPRE